jgi:transposase-like protein
MPQRVATIRNVTKACRMIKAMSSQGVSWAEDYRSHGRDALKGVLEERMNSSVDSYLEDLASRGGEQDRRNGRYSRHLLTELGDIELAVPRTRHFSALKVVHAYARRATHIDRLILACFVFGVSTRKVAQALLPVLGEKVSASTVSRIGKQLDTVVGAFHRRPLKDQYRVLIFDGVVLSRKSGAGALRRPVLVVLGIRPNGKKEIIDFRLAPGESQEAWEAFLNDLYNRGVKGESTKMIVTDGGTGLLAALPLVYPHIPLQRCWAHKIRNVLDKVKKKDHPNVKRDLHRIMNAPNLVKARRAAGRFAERWAFEYPKAVRCLKTDLEDLLTFFTFKDSSWWKAIRTTNSIERRFREVRRRTRPMGVFSDRTSIERILYAVFSYENKQQGISTPFLVTQNS